MLFSEETLTQVGHLEWRCVVNPRRMLGPEPGAAVYITRPKNGDVLPRDTREVAVEGVVTREEIRVVNVQGRPVPVMNGRFETVVRMAADTLNIDVNVSGDSGWLAHTDGVIVCREPRQPQK
jgi:hypothetical protein